MSFQKVKAWRNKKYLEWVGTLPSVLSGNYTGKSLSKNQTNDPHHVKGHGHGGSVKAPDYMTMPLTRPEHNKFHYSIQKDWELENGNQLRHALHTLVKALEAGVLVIDEDRASELIAEFKQSGGD
ncbi:MAG: DUF968 domain-containing protein [Arenicella sp.]